MVVTVIRVQQCDEYVNIQQYTHLIGVFLAQLVNMLIGHDDAPSGKGAEAEEFL